MQVCVVYGVDPLAEPVGRDRERERERGGREGGRERESLRAGAPTGRAPRERETEREGRAPEELLALHGLAALARLPVLPSRTRISLVSVAFSMEY
jgi:hypothetical protein